MLGVPERAARTTRAMFFVISGLRVERVMFAHHNFGGITANLTQVFGCSLLEAGAVATVELSFEMHHWGLSFMFVIFGWCFRMLRRSMHYFSVTTV